jgi:hypothetical protein
MCFFNFLFLKKLEKKKLKFVVLESLYREGDLRGKISYICEPIILNLNPSLSISFFFNLNLNIGFNYNF